MKCADPDCKAELDLEKTKVEEASHDPKTLEIHVRCNKCHKRNYTFFPASDLIV